MTDYIKYLLEMDEYREKVLRDRVKKFVDDELIPKCIDHLKSFNRWFKATYPNGAQDYNLYNIWNRHKGYISFLIASPDGDIKVWFDVEGGSYFSAQTKGALSTLVGTYSVRMVQNAIFLPILWFPLLPSSTNLFGFDFARSKRTLLKNRHSIYHEVFHTTDFSLWEPYPSQISRGEQVKSQGYFQTPTEMNAWIRTGVLRYDKQSRKRTTFKHFPDFLNYISKIFMSLQGHVVVGTNRQHSFAPYSLSTLKQALGNEWARYVKRIHDIYVKWKEQGKIQ